jgi:hypothetical protein
MSAVSVNESSSPSFQSPPQSSVASESDQSRVDKRVASKGKLWTGRVLSTLAVLFLLFDASGKIMMPAPVVEASARLGFPISLSVGVGILLLVCTILYAVPRTAPLGAVLLTGFLGGAVAIQMRAGSPMFETVFPVLFGVIVWAGILLRENRLLQIFPLRRPRPQR